jgi:hypothetical protein
MTVRVQAQKSQPGAAPFSIRGRGWALAFALAAMLVMTIPYLIANQLAPHGWRFSGFLFAVEDGNSYIAKMLSGAAGAWLFRSPYSATPQNGVVAFLPYILLGKLAAPPGLHDQLAAIFHLFRIGAGCLTLLAVYDFTAYFVRDEGLRRFGLLLAAFGGGLGWLLVAAGASNWLGSLPLDFISPETFGFLGLFGFPHLGLARAALFWGLLRFTRSVEPGADPGARDVLVTGGWWLAAALFQPLTALVMGAVIAGYLLALGLSGLWLKRHAGAPNWSRWRATLRFAFLSGLIPAPFLLYNAVAFSRDAYLVAWTDQNLILSPPLPHYLLAYGLLLPFAWIGSRNLIARLPYTGWLPVAWVCAVPFLAYAPVNLQRRLVEGAWIALIVLACCSVSDTGRWKISRRFFMGASLLLFPSTLFLIFGGLSASVKAASPAFIPADQAAVFEQLGKRAVPGSAVLASYSTANALPAWAPLRVLAGHGPESANLAELQPRVEAFYKTDTSDAERQALLDEFRIAYIFYGPAERALGGWTPENSSHLQLLAEQGEYAVYQVLE